MVVDNNMALQIFKSRGYCTFVLLSCLLIASVGDDENNAGQSQSGMPTNIIDTAKALFSLPTTPHSLILRGMRALFQQGSPPNLDFRGSSGDHDQIGNEGATDKVKGAMMKSLDKSKSSVENSAKFAAKFADEAVDKTVKKLKKTFPGKDGEEVAEL